MNHTGDYKSDRPNGFGRDFPCLHFPSPNTYMWTCLSPGELSCLWCSCHIYKYIYIFSGNGTVGTTLGKILGILYHSALTHFIWVLCCPVSFLLFAPGFYFSVIINYNSYCFFSLVSLT